MNILQLGCYDVFVQLGPDLCHSPPLKSARPRWKEALSECHAIVSLNQHGYLGKVKVRGWHTHSFQEARRTSSIYCFPWLVFPRFLALSTFKMLRGQRWSEILRLCECVHLWLLFKGGAAACHSARISRVFFLESRRSNRWWGGYVGSSAMVFLRQQEEAICSRVGSGQTKAPLHLSCICQDALHWRAIEGQHGFLVLLGFQKDIEEVMLLPSPELKLFKRRKK